MTENVTVKSEKKPWHYLLRGAASFIALFLLKSLTTKKLTASLNSGIPSQLFYGFAFLGIILIYNSLVHTLTFYDKDSFLKFKKRGIKGLKNVSLGKEVGVILKSLDFWLETLPVVILSVVFAIFGGFYETVFTVFPEGKAPEFAHRLFPLASIPLLLFLTSLFCRYEIHRYWADLYKKGEENKVDSKVKFLLKLCIVFAMYPLVYPYAPIILYVIITFFGMVGALISILSVLGFIASVTGVIFLSVWLKRRKVAKIKKKFLKQVTMIAEEKGESLTVYTKEERAVRGYDFTLTSDGKAYDCKIITSLLSTTPLYFTPSDAYFLYKIGTKEHHTSLEKHFEYAFASDSKKLMILIKFPRKVFVSEFGATRKLFSGDRIWNYIIFDPKSFLGAQDRECLHRSNEENR